MRGNRARMRSGAAHFELFAARDASRCASQYERALQFRWLQLMGRERGIYNVDNTHRCFEVVPSEGPPNVFAPRSERPVHLVQPFHCEPQFFGCLVCARHHFCRGARDTCEIVCGEDRVEVCRYSGRVLPLQDNLQPTYEDTSRRRPALARHVANSRCPPLWGARHDPSAKAEARKKRAQRAIERKARAAARASAPRQHRARRVLVLDDCEISVESWDESGDASSDESTQESDSASSASEEPSEWSASCDDDEESDDAPRKRTRDSQSEDTREESDESSDVSSQGDYDDEEARAVARQVRGEDGDEWDGGALPDERHCAYQKNYHNNLAYHNEYYAFMRVVCRRWAREKRSRVLARDVRATQRAIEAPAEEATQPEVDRVFQVSESTRDKITTECDALLHELLSAQHALDAKESALQYYVPLLCAITALVYGSQKLELIARTRSRKSQKQQKQPSQLSRRGHATLELAQLDTLQSDAEYHEFTLCPRKITRALMHYMLVQPFELSDTLDHLVVVWARDEWLARAVAALPGVEAQRRAMESCVNTLRQALAQYAHCPLWLRAHLLCSGGDEA